uniref:Semialdehyde dehydrogenase NAD-binding domain-containing protein n=1 Tax=Glossina palpalis gambiensis TaxID=67801 RepID=A0A1B0C7N3_9MUSC
MILKILIELDIIVSCQGNNYTKIMHDQLRNLNWQGYWIDAASTLRMHKNSCIVLEPINNNIIKKKISQGCKDFIGAYNIIPWIGKKFTNQQSCEEKKYQEESRKILNLNRLIPIDGICLVQSIQDNNSDGVIS